jgi:hypothetical protein
MKNWHGVTLLHLFLIIIIVGVAWINFNSLIPKKDIRDIKIVDISLAEKVTQDAVYDIKSLNLYMGKFVWIKNVSIVSSETFKSKKENKVLKVTLQDSLPSSIEGVFLHEDWSIFTKVLIRSGKKFDLLVKVNTFNEKTSFSAKYIKLSTTFNKLLEPQVVDTRTPKESFKKACKDGEINACLDQGNIELQNENEFAAMTLFKKACESGVMEGCSKAGSLEVVRGNHDEATILFKKSCDGGFMGGCYEQGHLLINKGLYVEAKVFMEMVCKS